ncbi:MAG: hypothetical protein M1828_002591 [Chrysothrix sp. TS-e1954]|nr:MAG: hypothetical protein M1828_002591 [Chrysothrix sp. TS-e1954]
MSTVETSTQALPPPPPTASAMGVPVVKPYPQIDPNTLPKTIMPSLPTLPSISSTMKRKRQPAKIMKPTKLLKKSASAPSIKKALDTIQDDDSGNDWDKKRNKLGYHRTSVACDDDPSGRCSNCIRLKKECNFYPVDQNLPDKGRAASAPKYAKGHISSTSPPEAYLGSSYPGHDGYPFTPHGSYSLPPDAHHPAGLAIYNAGPSPMSDPPSAYHHPSYSQPPGGWHHSYQDMPSITAAPSDPYNLSHQSPLPISPPTAPYHRPSSSFDPSAFSGQPGPAMPSRSDLTWTSQAPSRSLSLSVHEPQHPSARYSYSPQPLAAGHEMPVLSRRTSSIPQPPPLVAGNGDDSSTPSLSEPMSVGSMSAPVPNYSTWQGQWGGGHYGPGSDGFKPVGHRPEYPPVEPNMWYPDPIDGY